MPIENSNRRQFTDELTANYNSLIEDRDKRLEEEFESLVENVKNIKFAVEFNDGGKIDYMPLNKESSPELVKSLIKTLYHYETGRIVNNILDDVFDGVAIPKGRDIDFKSRSQKQSFE